ncbi:MAG: CDP-diacylglycerol--glycerol-3-phosphate 3-phosphatidyltransferase [Clostridia bacterium]|nr:CDP-diacylglycerol--glycerol-3-phosphate 3-phosphatidyltransferase [Clostridia bacterium]
MNLPNKLTVARMFMIPVVIAAIMLGGIAMPEYIAYPLAALLFGITSYTDYLDGKIARKYNLITDFGKFMDPLADKLLVIGTMLCILYKFEQIRVYFFWAVLLVIFRELTVTGLRAIAASAPSGEVIAANRLGKIKTVTQMVCLLSVLVEPALQKLVELILGGAGEYVLHDVFPLSIVTTLTMAVFTLWSGIAYLYQYRRFLKG